MSLEEDRYDNVRMLLRSGYDLWEDLEWIESELYPTKNADIIEFIKDFVGEPPSLLDCCRNALRKHMGPRISAYLSAVNAPEKVTDVILLKDVLSSDDPASADDVVLDMWEQIHTVATLSSCCCVLIVIKNIRVDPNICLRVCCGNNYVNDWFYC